ncbi:hypothetical protein [Ancylomarina sp. 16SWW S1-10-2]|uniref:hypothetical protein n=1 Tax=Ancylomarina sp. 16SWW S1-10-2 TaxID=2499681 RepID=UPI0012AD82EB|nr:hypothetical protein [Ancylomarina sp. 16SWW S1-10-2]MRT94065.1 hypothetical protein [Ancylomarina sp. 16SWW S1-10-2]
MKWKYKIVFINALKWNKSGLPNDLNLKFDELDSSSYKKIRCNPTKVKFYPNSIKTINYD